jgi:phospholipid/cholesterol/gamma-HCH transport system ATP-binding protein
MMHTLPPAAQEAMRDDLEGTHKYAVHTLPDEGTGTRHRIGEDETDTGRIPVSGER